MIGIKTVGKSHIDSKALTIIGRDLEGFIAFGITVRTGGEVRLFDADGVGSNFLGRFDKMKTLRESGFGHAAVHVVNNADIGIRTVQNREITIQKMMTKAEIYAPTILFIEKTPYFLFVN